VVRFLPFLISLVLSVYALFSCIQTRDEDVPYLPKLVWIILIVFVPFVGPIVWLLVSRTEGVRRERTARPGKPTARPVAPDDDPDFLASLERYRDPRTTVRPPKPDEPANKDKPAADDQPGDPVRDAVQDEVHPEKPSEKSKGNKSKGGKAKDETESEAPTESDDGKP
jgi:hypothetical protein